jgi:hypothetical protein
MSGSGAGSNGRGRISQRRRLSGVTGSLIYGAVFGTLFLGLPYAGLKVFSGWVEESKKNRDIVGKVYSLASSQDGKEDLSREEASTLLERLGIDYELKDRETVYFEVTNSNEFKVRPLVSGISDPRGLVGKVSIEKAEEYLAAHARGEKQ